MAMLLFLALAMGIPWTNFIVGGIAGVLLYPVIEEFILSIIDEE
jgi:hypothetical protein